MSVHHRRDVTGFISPLFAQITTNKSQRPTHAILPKMLPRRDARILAERRAGREVRQFFYDARNGRASWL